MWATSELYGHIGREAWDGRRQTWKRSLQAAKPTRAIRMCLGIDGAAATGPDGRKVRQLGSEALELSNEAPAQFSLFIAILP